MNTRWVKVRADLVGNKLRSGLAIAAMAVGTAVVGATTVASTTVAASFESSFLDANPPSAVLRADPFDASIVDAASGHPAVGAVEGRRLHQTQASAAGVEAVGIELVGMDFASNVVAHIDPVAGEWPPAADGIVLERASLPELGLAVGDELVVERPGREPLALTVIGTAFDVYEVAPMLGGSIRGYVTMDTMETLTGSRELNALFVRAAERPMDHDSARAVATALRDDVLAPAGVAVTASATEAPSTHRAQDSISFVVLAMQLLSVFALVIAVSLVVNTVTALLVQQRQQLGVMKAIGASTQQLTAQYLAYVVALALAALAVAVPASILLGGGIAAFVARLANIELASAGVPFLALGLQLVLGIVVPVAAVLVAVSRACRTTVREAITDRGLTDDVRPPRVSFPLRRTLLLAYRNAVRNRTRLALTVVTIAVCGGVLVGVSSTGSALHELGDEVLGYSAYDVEVNLSETVPGRAAAVLAAHPEVDTVEGWLRKDASLVRSDGTELDGISLTAAPPDSSALAPTLLAGRWLRSDDDHAIVINTHLADAAPELRVGTRLALRTDGIVADWTVVGVSSTTLVGPVAYLSVDQLARSLGDADGVNSLVVRLDPGADQLRAAGDLRRDALDAGLPVAQVTTNDEVRAYVNGLFDIVVVLLLLVGVVLAVVAVIGVAGTMTLGVVEQTRELGVLRTLGASSWTVRRILLLQGVATATIGGVLGVALSLPTAALLRAAIGNTLISAAMPFGFSWVGLGVWVATAVSIGALGAVQPARIASRRTIRETLAYA